MRILKNHDATLLSTFRVPATVPCYAEYESAGELREILRSEECPHPFFHIGQGSNILFTGEFQGTLVRCTKEQISFEGGRVTASSAVSLDTLALESCKKGLWGLENLSGIPGTVGAAVAGNAGAYGAETKDRLVEITCFDAETDEVVTFAKADLEFGYRFSSFKTDSFKGRYCILEATFELSTEAAPNIGYGNLSSKLEGVELTPLAIRNAVNEIRESKLPDLQDWGCAGSFFKNPVISPEAFQALESQICSSAEFARKDIPHFEAPGGIKVPAAYLIEQAGLKGATSGAAFLWPKQPLVLSVDLKKNPKAEDVISLDAFIRRSVKEKFNINLEKEVIYL